MNSIKHILRKLFLSLLLAATALFFSAQSPRTESITIASGLSQGMIYDIEQTEDGFLWFATKDGLNRYDGYRFEVFTNDPFNPFSIAGNDISCIFEDSRGNLWLCILGKGVDMLERNSGRFLHLPAAKVAHGETVPTFGNVVETPDGSIWIASTSGLMKLNWKQPGTVNTDTPDLLSSLVVEWLNTDHLSDQPSYFNLIANEDGSLNLSLRGKGIYQFSPATGSFQLILPSRSLTTSIFKTSSGNRWAMADEKLFFIGKDNKPREIAIVKDLTGSFISILYSDDNDNLFWVETSLLNGSRFFMIPEKEALESGSLANSSLVYLSKLYSPWSDTDHSGNLWVGTSGYGLRKVNLTNSPFKTMLKDTSIRQILALDRIYLPLGPTLQILDEAADQTYAATGFPKDFFVIAFCHSRSGVDWFAGHLGQPLMVSVSGGQITQYPLPFFLPNFSQLVEDAQGRLWTGATGGRLQCFIPSENSTAWLDYSNLLGKDSDAQAFFLEPSQTLWVGTSNGILKAEISKIDFKVSGGKIVSPFPMSTYQTDPSDVGSLRHNVVTSFCPDPLEPERYLWVSTKGGGLNLLDKTTGKFQHFTSLNSGLPNDVVYGILPDDLGNLWMSTNRGLSRLTIDSNRNYRFKNFREFDGLQGDEFNTSSFAKGKDGRLYFGGVNGLTVFDPSEITDRKSDAAVLITSLKINNRVVDYFQKGSPLSRPVYRTEHIQLDYNQNLVTFEFALMDFLNPQENRYRYRLLGIDPDWVEAGTNHSANYANLRPGNYTFEVQGSISGGQWSAPASLKITVLPPWWATWWAYALYALSIGGAFFAFYKIRMQQRLEHQEALRLRELDEFKSRFFTNITHEFRTPLTVILGNLEMEKLEIEKLGKPADTKISQFLHFLVSKNTLTRRNAESLLRLINQILDLAKLESNSLKINYVQGDVLPWLRYISESLHSFANAQNVMLRLESKEQEIVMDYDPERLLQIVHNLLSNAIKFTPSGGRVTLNARLNSSSAAAELGFGGTFTLTVADTGVGIPPEDLPHIFDRFYQANNLEKAKAGGTGIGLALTKELVKALGGEISVKSEVGKGTMFTVRLPVRNEAKRTDRVTPGHLVTSEVTKEAGFQKAFPTSPKSEHPSILIVEDNPDVVEYLAACLGENYQLDFAYNGRAGIEKALETVPDLIVSDVMMPEKDGLEVCNTLKNDERTSHIPIVLLTAKADVESRIAGLKRGADAYLAKPFHQEELLVTLANLLELRRKLQAKYGDWELVIGDSPPQSPIASQQSPEDVFLKKLYDCIAENMSDPGFDGGRLARAMNLSEVQLYRKIKALTDKSTAIYIRHVRLMKGRELLRTTNLNVSEIAYEVGFDDPNYFSRTFSQEFGVAPSEVRK